MDEEKEEEEEACEAGERLRWRRIHARARRKRVAAQSTVCPLGARASRSAVSKNTEKCHQRPNYKSVQKDLSYTYSI
jgi:hypothetical protein